MTSVDARPVVLVVQHERDTGPGWWSEWLAEAGVRLDVRHPYDPVHPAAELPGLDAYDGLVVLGGAMGPADDGACSWLPATRALLADAVSTELPTFGICLGAELLVVACGGNVRRGPAGPELGVLPMDLTDLAGGDPVFDALPARPRVLQWHWEEMDVLPAGAVLLASSESYPNQAFRLGETAWGVQGHPEVSPEIAAAWAREDSPLLLAAGRRPDDLVAELTEAREELQFTWRPVAQGFARTVRDHASARSAR